MTSIAVRVRPTGRRHFGDTHKRASIRGFVEAVAELRMGRALTAAEQRVDWLTIDDALEAGKKELHAAIEEEKRRAIKDVATTGRTARLSVTGRMVAALQALHDVGVKEAIAELRALGIEPRTVFAEVEPWLQQLTYRLQASLNGIGYRIEREVTPLTAIDMSRAELAAAAERRVPGALDAASRLVSSGFTSGLGEIFGTNFDLVGRWEYSAVGDANTCEECELSNGTEYDTWELAQQDLPDGGPNPDCYGNGRCRCRLIPASAADETVAAPIVGAPVDEVGASYDVGLLPDYARAAVHTLSVVEATEQRSRLGSYYRTLKGHMDAGRRTRIPGKLEAMEARLADLDRYIESGGKAEYDVALLPEYTRAPVDTLTLDEATAQHERLAKYYRSLKGHADAGRRAVAPEKLTAMELRLKDLARRIDDLGGETAVTPVVRPRPVEPVVVLPPTTGRTEFAKDIDAIAQRTSFPRSPASHSRVSIDGPTAEQREAYARVIEAGQRAAQEITSKIAGSLDNARDAIREAEARVVSSRAAVVRINDDYGARIRAINDKQQAVFIEIRDRFAREQFGVPWSRVGDLASSGDLARLARAQPEYTKLDTEAIALRAEWQQRVLPDREALDKAYDDQKAATKELLDVERAAILDTLGEVREMGGAQWRYSTPGRTGKAKKILDAAAPYYPRAWITNTRELGVRYTPGRAGFLPQIHTIKVDNSLGSAIHELAHAQEYRDPRIVSLEQTFYEWRIRGGSWDGPRETPSWMGRGYGRQEKARQDQFSEKYMGKDYGGSFYELLSMGLEALWRADNFEVDDEYRTFILGILALV